MFWINLKLWLKDGLCVFGIHNYVSFSAGVDECRKCGHLKIDA